MPYAPGVVDQSGQFIGQGLSQMGQSIGGAIERYQELKAQKEKDERTKQGLVRALKPFHQELGYLSPDEMLNDNSDSVLGRMKGLVTAQTLQEHEARMKDYAARAAAREQGATEDAAIGEALQRFSGQPGPVAPPTPTPGLLYSDVLGLNPSSAPAPQSNDARIRAALATPNLGGRGAVKLLEMLERYPGGDGAITYEEDPVTGQRVARFGKTVLPSGINPAKAQNPTIVPQFDEDGKEIGQSFFDGKKWQFRPSKKYSNQLQQAVDDKGRAIPGIYVNLNTGHHVDTRSGMMRSMGVDAAGGGGAAPAATDAAPPAGPEPAAAPAPAAAPLVMTPKTPEDYAKIPSGVLYRHPVTGQIMRKK